METKTIHLKELEALLENEETADKTLEEYFDFEFVNPFSPNFQPKENVEIIYPESAEGEVNERGMRELIINLANLIYRKKRQRQYKETITQNPKAIRIVSEGDSWFQYPHPKVIDIIDHLSKQFAVYSVGAAGDELKNMYREEEYMKAIEEVNPQFFLISGGGNDILGEQFRHFLRSEYKSAPPGENPDRFLKNAFFAELENLGLLYHDMMEQITSLKPNIKILIHGYDYIIPGSDPESGWLGRYMIEKGILDPKDRQALINLIIDCFNETILENTAPFENVFYIDCRKCVPSDKWYDEIHPDSLGFDKVAGLFTDKIHSLI